MKHSAKVPLCTLRILSVCHAVTSALWFPGLSLCLDSVILLTVNFDCAKQPYMPIAECASAQKGS